MGTQSRFDQRAFLNSCSRGPEIQSTATSFEEAQAIIGATSCLSPTIASRVLRITAVAEPAYSGVPFTAATLYSCRGTHVLLPMVPMTIARLSVAVPDATFEWGDDASRTAWLSEPFANLESTDAGWLLLRRTVISPSMSFAEQLGTLSSGEFVPRACEVLAGTVMWFLATGQRLLDREYARCSSVAKTKHHILVGAFTPRGLQIAECHDLARVSCIGLATAVRGDIR